MMTMVKTAQNNPVQSEAIFPVPLKLRPNGAMQIYYYYYYYYYYNYYN